MAWNTPTADDVLSEFTPTELATITTLLGSAPMDNTGKLAAILTRTVFEIRDYIRSGGYSLDADVTTIPDGFFNDAIAMTRWRFLVSAPQFKQLQTEERKALYQASLDKMLLVASIKFGVEDPADVAQAGDANWNSENKLMMRTHPIPRPGTQFTPAGGQYANPDAPADTGAT
jgi:hypothetical protein